MAASMLILAIVALGYQPPEKDSSLAAATNEAQANISSSSSVDPVLATDIASGVAERANLPIASSIVERSQSLAAESVLTKSSASAVSKPTILQPTDDSRDVRTYVTKSGDTVNSVASKFGITANTLKWANNLSSNNLSANKKLKIPPVDGIIYTVKSGDSIAGIATKFKANKEDLIVFNDLEIDSIKKGQQLIIPGGAKPAVRPTVYSGGYKINSAYASASAGNRYAYGYCTWYAYERRVQLGRPIGSFWGNATTWAAYAAASGHKVGSTPKVGSIMQNSGGWRGYGHVAIVEAVNPGVSITISEMNGYRFGGGFNLVGRGNIPWSQATNGVYRYIE